MGIIGEAKELLMAKKRLEYSKREMERCDKMSRYYKERLDTVPEDVKVELRKKIQKLDHQLLLFQKMHRDAEEEIEKHKTKIEKEL